eukprot:392893_1
MCWSWEVSLTFAVIDILGLLYSLYRNQYLDRYFVLILSPIAIQELCQFFLWKFGITSNTKAFECNNVNLLCNFIISAVIVLIPVFISFTSYRTISTTHTHFKQVNIFWKYLLWIYVILYICYFISIIFLYLDGYCIIVGRFGHQVWLHDLGIWGEIIINIYYLSPFFFVLVLYVPRWVVFIPTFLLLTIFITLRIAIGTEAYSVWCWSGIVAISWAVLHVPIAKWLVVSEYISTTSISYKHLVQFKVIDNIEANMESMETLQNSIDSDNPQIALIQQDVIEQNNLE